MTDSDKAINIGVSAKDVLAGKVPIFKVGNDLVLIINNEPVTVTGFFNSDPNNPPKGINFANGDKQIFANDLINSSIFIGNEVDYNKVYNNQPENSDSTIDPKKKSEPVQTDSVEKSNQSKPTENTDVSSRVEQSAVLQNSIEIDQKLINDSDNKPLIINLESNNVIDKDYVIVNSNLSFATQSIQENNGESYVNVETNSGPVDQPANATWPNVISFFPHFSYDALTFGIVNGSQRLQIVDADAQEGETYTVILKAVNAGMSLNGVSVMSEMFFNNKSLEVINNELKNLELQVINDGEAISDYSANDNYNKNQNKAYLEISTTDSSHTETKIIEFEFIGSLYTTKSVAGLDPDINITYSNGLVKLSDINTGGVYTSGDNWIDIKYLTVEQLNYNVKNIVFVPNAYNPNDSSLNFASYNYNVTGDVTGSGAKSYQIVPTTAQNINIANSSTVFSAANNNAITVENATGSGVSLIKKIVFQLEATDGTIKLGSNVTDYTNIKTTDEGVIISKDSNNINIITIKDTVANVNKILDGLIFTPNSDFSGTAKINIVVNDLYNTGISTTKALSYTDGVNINVNASSILATDKTTWINNVVLSESNNNQIKINDPSGANNVTVKLIATGGTLSDANTPSVNMIVSGNNSNTITISGANASAVTDYLNGLKFTKDPNFFGSGKIEVLTNDLPNNIVTNIDTDPSSSKFTINVVGLNTAVTSEAFDRFYVNSDLSFSSAQGNAITVSNVTTNALINIQLVATNGTLITKAGDNAATITLSGKTPTEINNYLEGLIFRPTVTDGSATISIKTNDLVGAPLTDVSTTVKDINISVVNVPVTATNSYTEGSAPVDISNSINLQLSNVNSYNNAKLVASRTEGANSQDYFNIKEGSGFTLIKNSVGDITGLSASGHKIADVTNGNGSLTIDFVNTGTTVTAALVNGVAQAIQYKNISPTLITKASLSYEFFDNDLNSNNSNPVDSLVSSIKTEVNIIHPAPVIKNLEPIAVNSFTEGVSSPQLVSSNISINAPQLDALNGSKGDYNGAHLTISRDGAANSHDTITVLTDITGGIKLSGDNLIINSTGKIIGSLDHSVSGALTINFSNNNGILVTTEMVNNIAKAVLFSTTDTSIKTDGLAKLNYIFNDGIDIVNPVNSSATALTGVTIKYSLPTIQFAPASFTYTEGNVDGVAISSVTINDKALQALNDYAGSSLTISRSDTNGNFIPNSHDYFKIDTVAGVDLTSIATLTYTDNIKQTGALTVAFNKGVSVSEATVNAIAKAITFSTADTGILNNSMVNLAYKFNNGILGVAETKVVNNSVKITYDSPNVTITADPAAIYLEGKADGSVITQNLTIYDKALDAKGDYTGSSITIARSVVSTKDSFGVLDGSNDNIKIVGNDIQNLSGQKIASLIASNGQLTINFGGVVLITKDMVNEVAKAITYKTTDTSIPSNTPQDLTYTFSNGIKNIDGSVINPVSVTSSINVGYLPSSVNITDITGGAKYIEGGTSAATIASAVDIVDPSLSLANNYNGAALVVSRQDGNSYDVFKVVNGSGFTVSGNNIIDSAAKTIASLDYSVPGTVKIIFGGTGVATQTMVNNIAKSITFITSDATIVNNDVETLNYTFYHNKNDLTNFSQDTTDITITYAPATMLVTGTTTGFVEGSGVGVSALSSVTITDPVAKINNNYAGCNLTVGRYDTNGAPNIHDYFKVGTVPGVELSSDKLSLLNSAIAGKPVIATLEYTDNVNYTGALTVHFSKDMIISQAVVNAITKAVTFSTTDTSITNNAYQNINYKFTNAGGVDVDKTVTLKVSYSLPSITATIDNALYTEGSANGGVVISSNVTITDKALNTLGDYSGSSLTIVRYNVSAANSKYDHFDFSKDSGIIVTQVNNDKFLSLNGLTVGKLDSTDSMLKVTFGFGNTAVDQATVNNIAKAITFSTADTSITNNGSQNLQYSFSNGIAGVGAVGTISIVKVNYAAPTIDIKLNQIANYVEGNSDGVIIAASSNDTVNISDQALNAKGDYTGSSLTIARYDSSGKIVTKDLFGVFDGDNINIVNNNILNLTGQKIASLTVSAGMLKITFGGDLPITQAMVNEIAREITYKTTDTSIQNNTAQTLQYSFNNGVGGIGITATLPDTVKVNVSYPLSSIDVTDKINDAYIQGHAAVLVADTAAIVDPSRYILNVINNYNDSMLVVSRQDGNSYDVFKVVNGSGFSVSGSSIIDSVNKTVASLDYSTPGSIKIIFGGTGVATQELVNNIAKSITFSTADTTIKNNDIETLNYNFYHHKNDLTNFSKDSIDITINYDPINMVFTQANTSYKEGSGIVDPIAATVSITDPAAKAAGNYAGCSLTVSRYDAQGNPAPNSYDYFKINSVSGIKLSDDKLSLLDSITSKTIANLKYTDDVKQSGELTIEFSKDAVISEATVNSIAKAVTFSTVDTTIANNFSLPIKYKFTNAGGIGVAQDLQVQISYNPPTATLIQGASKTYTEGYDAVGILSNITIADQALNVLNDYTNSYLTISRKITNEHDVFKVIDGLGFKVNGQDILDANNFSVIAKIDDSIHGKLKITFGGDTLVSQSMVNNIVKAITFSTTDTTIANNSSPTLTYEFNNGIPGVTSKIFDVAGINSVKVTYDAPSLSVTTDPAAIYLEGKSDGALITSNVTISDKALDAKGDYTGSSLNISRSTVSSKDSFGVYDSQFDNIKIIDNNIQNLSGQKIAGLTVANGQLTITFGSDLPIAITKDMVNEVAKAITYKTTDTSIQNNTAQTLQYSFNNGVSGVAAKVATANINVSYDAASIQITNANNIYTEGLEAKAIAAEVKINDPALYANNNYNGSSLTIARYDANNNVHASDLFNIVDGTVSGIKINNPINKISSVIDIATGKTVANLDYSVNGQLTIKFGGNGVATQDIVNNIAKAITFSTADTTIENNSLPNLTYSFKNGIVSVTNVAEFNANIKVTYAAPELIVSGTEATYTEGLSAKTIATTVTINDPALNSIKNYNGSSLTVARYDTNGNVHSSDSFNIVDGTIPGFKINTPVDKISSIIDAAGKEVAKVDYSVNGQLTIKFGGTGVATQATVNAIAKAITFSTNDATIENNSTQSITYKFDNGIDKVNPIFDEAGFSIKVNYNIPTIELAPSATNSFTMGGEAQIISDNINISSMHLDAINNYNNTVLTVKRINPPGGVFHGTDEFGLKSGDGFGLSLDKTTIVAGGNSIADFTTDSNGVLTIAFHSDNNPPVSAALIDNIAKSITYKHISDTLITNAELQYTFDDKLSVNSVSTPVVTKMTILHDAPIISMPSDVVEGHVMAGVDNNVPLSSVNNLITISSPQLKAINNYNNSKLMVSRDGLDSLDDTFSIASQNEITLDGNNIKYNDIPVATFSNLAGKLTITFTSANMPVTEDIVNNVAQAIQYDNNSKTAINSVKLEYQFDDGLGASNSLSASYKTTVNIAYQAPSINLSPTADNIYVETSAAVGVSSSTDISDPFLDSLNIVNGVAKGNYAGASLTVSRADNININDNFSFGSIPNVTVGTGTLSYTGIGIIANYTNSNGVLKIDFVNSGTIQITSAMADNIAKAIKYNYIGDSTESSVTLNYKFDNGLNASNSITEKTTVITIDNNDATVLVPVSSSTSPLTVNAQLNELNNTPLVFSESNNNVIKIVDFVAEANPSMPITVQLSADNGKLTLSNGILNNSNITTSSDNKTITINDNLININNYLKDGVKFVPNADFSGATAIKILANDLSPGLINSASSTEQNIYLAVNNSKVVMPSSTTSGGLFDMHTSLQAAQSNDNLITKLIFSEANGNAIKVIDNSSNSVSVQLNSDKGLISLIDNTGVTAVSSSNNHVLTINGSLASVNASLAKGVAFTADANNTSGVAKLTVVTNDLNNVGINDHSSYSDFINIDVNNATITGPSSQINIKHDYSNVIQFSSSGSSLIQIVDPMWAGSMQNITAKIISEHGVITGGAVNSNAIEELNNLDGETVTIIDTLNNINAYLTGMIFTPNDNYSGVANIKILVNDIQGINNIQSISATDDSTYVKNINIGVNNATVSLVSPVVGLNVGGGSLEFSFSKGNAIKVIDDSGSDVTLLLKATGGTLSFINDPSMLNVNSIVDPVSKNIIITGQAEDINYYLDGMKFNPYLSYSGSAGIAIAVNDLSNVTQINDASNYNQNLKISSNNASVSLNVAQTNIKSAVILSDTNLTIADKISANIVNVKLVAANGQLSLANSTDSSEAITLSGTAAKVDADLIGLKFTPNSNYSGPASITVYANDVMAPVEGDASNAVKVLNFNVNNVPITVSVEQINVKSLNAISFSGDNIIKIGDNLINTDSIKVKLVAQGGYINVPFGAQTTFMDLTGTVGDIEAKLEGLQFTPAENFGGMAKVTIYANDIDSVSDIRNDSSSYSKTINIAVNNATINNINTGKYINLNGHEDSGKITLASFNNNENFINNDNDEDVVTVQLTSTKGTLSGDPVAGVDVNTSGNVLTITGATKDVNSYLGKLTFDPEDNFSGVADVVMRVNDIDGVGITDKSSYVDTLGFKVNNATVTAPQSVLAFKDSITFSDSNNNAILIQDNANVKVAVQITASYGSTLYVPLKGMVGTVFKF
jgi:hypothetical protein